MSCSAKSHCLLLSCVELCALANVLVLPGMTDCSFCVIGLVVKLDISFCLTDNVLFARTVHISQADAMHAHRSTQ